MAGYFRHAIMVVVLGMFASGCQTAMRTDFVDDGMALVQVASNGPVALPSSAYLPKGADAMTPIGYMAYCARNEGACTVSADEADTITLNADIMAQISQINFGVNRAIAWRSDDRHYGVSDFWTIPTDGYGDCEDYALAKREALIKAGFPARALRLTVVKSRKSGFHMVLTVATDRGDYVLYSLAPDIVAWRLTSYQWISRQDPSRANAWTNLTAPPTVLALASTAATAGN